ncbi:MAG: hypothetical protein E3J72_14795 [Planctomycetota bacterium]|nr:MAG: hypothetical protein E3J72_14795 [Planctomycetota bacterium]
MGRFLLILAAFIIGGVIGAAVTASIMDEKHKTGYRALEEKYDKVAKARNDIAEELKNAGKEIESLTAAMKEKTSSHEKKLESKDGEIASLKKEISDLTPEPVVKEPEPPAKELTEDEKKKEEDKKKLVELIERMQRIALIGTPLTESAIKDLGLDKDQVANINDVLKDEGERMTERLRELAESLVEGKTVEDFKDMNGFQISVEIKPYFDDELKKLMSESAENLKAMQMGEKHIVNFLSKDSNLYKINKAFYKERQATYDELAVHMDQETLDKFKNKYFESGSFIFPGGTTGAGYGTGKLTDEDFEE